MIDWSNLIVSVLGAGVILFFVQLLFNNFIMIPVIEIRHDSSNDANGSYVIDVKNTGHAPANRVVLTITPKAGVEQFFANMLGLPAAMALPIGLLEVIGGIALLVGVLTRLTSILFIIEMIGSTIVAKLPKGFVGGYELDLLFMAISNTILLTGPVPISVEWNVLKRDYFLKAKNNTSTKATTTRARYIIDRRASLHIDSIIRSNDSSPI